MDCPTILQQAVDRRASDIFIVAGTPLTIKINGETEHRVLCLKRKRRKC